MESAGRTNGHTFYDRDAEIYYVPDEAQLYLTYYGHEQCRVPLHSTATLLDVHRALIKLFSSMPRYESNIAPEPMSDKERIGSSSMRFIMLRNNPAKQGSKWDLYTATHFEKSYDGTVWCTHGGWRGTLVFSDEGRLVGLLVKPDNCKPRTYLVVDYKLTNVPVKGCELLGEVE